MEFQLGKAIQAFRKKRSLSQGQLAGGLHVSVQAVSKWETGKANPDLALLPRLAGIFGVTIDELFATDEAMPQISQALEQNSSGWDRIAASDWAGTVLPNYGPLTPDEEALCLLGDLRGKAVLELACGSGESLAWMEQRGVRELWGLDISGARLAQARNLLDMTGKQVRLFNAAMESDPGIPKGHFDLVYSIYGLGWTMDLDGTIARVAEYLKPGGTFVFSWDNPLMPCIEEEGGRFYIDKSCVDELEMPIRKQGADLLIKNWKLSSYLNALAGHGFLIQRVVEESHIPEGTPDRPGRYYSPERARLFNPVIVVKARKL